MINPMDSETLMLTLTNLALGAFVLLGFGLLLFALVRGILSRRRTQWRREKGGLIEPGRDGAFLAGFRTP